MARARSPSPCDRRPFRRFRAARRIRLTRGIDGAAEVRFEAGDEFDWDGTSVRLAGGQLVAAPAVAAMIAAGWAVPA
jgi:hypothetical protein